MASLRKFCDCSYGSAIDAGTEDAGDGREALLLRNGSVFKIDGVLEMS